MSSWGQQEGGFLCPILQLGQGPCVPAAILGGVRKLVGALSLCQSLLSLSSVALVLASGPAFIYNFP